MKIATGKTARSIRRHEIMTELVSIIDSLALKARNNKPTAFTPQQAISVLQEDNVSLFVNKARQLLFELTEISAIDANQTTRPRIRKH